MKKLISLAVFVLVMTLAATVDTTPAAAQQKKAPAPQVSPHATISKVIDKTNRVTVTYGRPYSKDSKTGEKRKIWGGLVPYGNVWRLGADEATTLITQQPIKMGETTVPAGAHTLYLLPAENGPSKLIISKQLGQWGIPYVGEAQDLARVDAKKEALDPPNEQFTMAIEATPGGGGVLRMMWEATQFSVPFTTQK